MKAPLSFLLSFVVFLIGKASAAGARVSAETPPPSAPESVGALASARHFLDPSLPAFDPLAEGFVTEAGEVIADAQLDLGALGTFAAGVVAFAMVQAAVKKITGQREPEPRLIGPLPLTVTEHKEFATRDEVQEIAARVGEMQNEIIPRTELLADLEKITEQITLTKDQLGEVRGALRENAALRKVNGETLAAMNVKIEDTAENLARLMGALGVKRKGRGE